jgi:hypothetical protein
VNPIYSRPVFAHRRSTWSSHAGGTRNTPPPRPKATSRPGIQSGGGEATEFAVQNLLAWLRDLCFNLY